MKKAIQSTLVLVCICAVMAVLLAITNAITYPTIKANEDKAANAAENVRETVEDSLRKEK